MLNQLTIGMTYEYNHFCKVRFCFEVFYFIYCFCFCFISPHEKVFSDFSRKYFFFLPYCNTKPPSLDKCSPLGEKKELEQVHDFFSMWHQHFLWILSYDLFYIQIRHEFDSEIFWGIQYSEASKFHYMYSTLPLPFISV